MKFIRKFLCKIGYHNYLYNHPSQPTRCECTSCGKKWKLVNNPKYIANVTSPLEEPIFTWEEIK